MKFMPSQQTQEGVLLAAAWSFAGSYMELVTPEVMACLYKPLKASMLLSNQTARASQGSRRV